MFINDIEDQEPKIMLSKTFILPSGETYNASGFETFSKNYTYGAEFDFPREEEQTVIIMNVYRVYDVIRIIEMQFFFNQDAEFTFYIPQGRIIVEVIITSRFFMFTGLPIHEQKAVFGEIWRE